ncbi:MAG: 2-phosphosulfolactate phosphatase [Bacteroidetes bacterium]|nr:2-phosphosulfolactate phosphatase [Bacteroidota bacterium]
MKINVLLSPLNADELFFTGKTTVVIDVLRASTVIVNAFENGAKEVVPVSSMEFAMKSSANAFGGLSILGGERNTKKIDGFTLGNSPLEYTEENVSGKSIVHFTTNGSKAIVKAKFSENLVVCAFSNLQAVAEYLLQLKEDVQILCAGSNGMFCMEDTVCAGKLIESITQLGESVEITDAGKASLVLYKTFGTDIRQMLSDSEHGKVLMDNGLGEDLDFCALVNSSTVIPFFKAGTIKPVKNDKEE